MRAVATLLSAAALALALLAPSLASAYENQWHAGAEAGYLGGWSGVGSGAGGTLNLGYGVRDWLDVTGSVDLSYHPASRILLPSGSAGVRFVFDVVQVVPYVGAQVGAAGVLITNHACSAGCSAARLDWRCPSASTTSSRAASPSARPAGSRCSRRAGQ